jgi:hypothetical protein
MYGDREFEEKGGRSSLEEHEEEHEAEVYFVGVLSRTRSGEMLRPTCQDVVEQRGPRVFRP